MVRQSLFMQPVPFPSSNFRLVRLQNHAGLSHCHIGATESRHLSAYMPFSSPQVAHHLPGWRTSWPNNSDLHSQILGQPATCVAALMGCCSSTSRGSDTENHFSSRSGAGETLQADESTSEGSLSSHSEAKVEVDEPELAPADGQVRLPC